MRLITILLALSFGLLTGCQQSHRQQGLLALEETIQGTAQNTASLQVVGPTGEGIARAQVLVGEIKSGRQVITTDEQGMFVAPDDWISNETVSIAASGYIPVTFYDQTPQNQKFQLRMVEKVPALEVKGVANGFAPYIADKDGNLDFALAMPMMTRDQVFIFNQTQVLSPEADIISVFGQKIPIPSNISLPQQREKYGLFSFTLEKPIYRLKVAETGAYPFVAIRARCGLDPLKSRLPPMELLNHVLINGGSERMAVVTPSGGKIDFEMGEQNFTGKVSLTAPAIPPGTVMVSAPLARSGEYFYPTDVKSLKSYETRQLNTTVKGNSDLLTILTSENQSRRATSAYLTSIGQQSKSLQFLGLFNVPTVNTEKIMVDLPTKPSDIEASGMYVTLSRIDVQKVGDAYIENTIRVWEFYLNNWTSEILLPQLPDGMGFRRDANVRYRWEINFMARETADAKEISYVTRNSVDI